MYRPPVRGIRSPYVKAAPQAMPQPFDLTSFVEMANKLKALIDNQTETNRLIEETHTKHQAAFGVLIEKAHAELARARTVQKGEKGDTPTLSEVVKTLLPLVTLPKGEKGDNATPPTADEVAQALMPHVLPKIKKLTPKTPTKDEIKRAVLAELPFFTADKGAPELDLEKLTDAVGEKMKKKGHPGVETTMESYLRRYGYRPYVHGGGDTVKAGTNVTITRNTDGTTTISATGGSGFTELSATETPDGATTVFTFASASAQPSYIVADNVWLKATSKSGVTNWTWNGGTKKATLQVPPNDDIFAIS